MTTEAYPLHWPEGRPRTKRPQPSRFGVSFASARDGLVEEIERLGGRNVVISTNVALRQDGLPYANQRTPDDPGVAVYFVYKGDQHCFACDQWDKVKDNIRATQKTIEALRGIARWGTGDMMQRAFTGFQALPDLDNEGAEWWEILGVARHADRDTVEAAYHTRRRDAHPDRGGSPAAFKAVQNAWQKFLQERGET